MEENGKLWAILAVGFLIGVIVGAIIISTPKGLTDKQCQYKISDAVVQATKSKNLEITEYKRALQECSLELSSIPKCENNEIPSEKDGGVSKYVFDEIVIGSPIIENIYDRKLSKLFDGEIDFDGDEIKAEEKFSLKDIEIVSNEEDFDGDVYLKVLEGGIEYTLSLESSFDNQRITDDRTINLEFLGEDIEISDWDENSIEITTGKDYSLEAGQEITIENSTLKILSISDDEVFVEVDGVARVIDEGKIKSMEGLDIFVKDSFSSETYSVAILKIGRDINQKVFSGDEYVEDSIWEYYIEGNNIGLVLSEEFDELDEEHSILSQKDEICLPNRYVCLRFDGMSDEDTSDYSFKYKEDYTLAKGDFVFEGDDYERIYIQNNSFFEDDDFEDEIDGTIYLSDSGIELTVIPSGIYIEDIKLGPTLENIFVNGINISSEDEDYRTTYGSLIKSPEDAIDDQYVKIVIPEEHLYGEISVF